MNENKEIFEFTIKPEPKTMTKRRWIYHGILFIAFILGGIISGIIAETTQEGIIEWISIGFYACAIGVILGTIRRLIDILKEKFQEWLNNK